MLKKSKVAVFGMSMFDSPVLDRIDRMTRLFNDPLADVYRPPVFRRFEWVNDLAKMVGGMSGAETKFSRLVRNPFAARVPTLGGGESTPDLEADGSRFEV